MTKLSTLNGLSMEHLSNGGHPEICIAVLDGLVDMNHPCFKGANLTRLPTLVQGEPDNKGSMSAHGTHVASVIFGQPGSSVKGIAPNCRGLIVPVFADGREGGLTPSRLTSHGQLPKQLSGVPMSSTSVAVS